MRREMVAESGKIKGRKEREWGQMGVRRRAWMPVFVFVFVLGGGVGA
jgi:hypothetical protein